MRRPVIGSWVMRAGSGLGAVLAGWSTWCKGYFSLSRTHPGLHLAARLIVALWASVFGALGGYVLAAAMSGPAHAGTQPPQPLQAAQPHQQALRREAQRVWGLQAPVATFAAQVQQESRWRPDARSPVGATGLAQFMPATAQWLGGVDATLADRAPLNPTWALRALVVYDHWLHQRVRTYANACQRMAFTLAAYNGGLGWVYKRQALAPAAGMAPGVCLRATCTLNPGVTPASQAENAHYPLAILALERAYLRWGPGACTT